MRIEVVYNPGEVTGIASPNCYCFSEDENKRSCGALVMLARVEASERGLVRRARQTEDR